MKLIDCVNIKHQDGTFLLVPKKECEMDLVMLGFDGTEKWLHLQYKALHGGIATGSYDYVATICDADGKTFS